MAISSFGKSVNNGIDKGLEGAFSAMDKGLLKADISAMQRSKTSLISELELERRKVLQGIGERLYDSRGIVDPGDNRFGDDIDKLDGLNARLQQLRSTMQFLKSNMAPVYFASCAEGVRCPECNGPISILDAACSSCGKGIDAMANRFTVCPSCGRVYDDAAAFCEECGVKLTGANLQSITDRRARLTKGVNLQSRVKCPACGKEANQGERFCKACGSALPQ